jgi:hypothetical protein
MGGALALQETAKTRTADLLLKLDDRFESQDMVAARTLMGTTRTKIETAVKAAKPKATASEFDALNRVEWGRELAAMKTSDPTGYMSLLSYAGFFETVGRMVDRNYISMEDVFGLFEHPIITMEHAFSEFAANRIAAGAPPGLFEYAFSLAARTKKMAAKKAAIKIRKAGNAG